MPGQAGSTLSKAAGAVHLRRRPPARLGPLLTPQAQCRDSWPLRRWARTVFLAPCRGKHACGKNCGKRCGDACPLNGLQCSNACALGLHMLPRPGVGSLTSCRVLLAAPALSNRQCLRYAVLITVYFAADPRQSGHAELHKMVARILCKTCLL